MSNVVLKSVPPVSVMAVRGIVKQPEMVGGLLGELVGAMIGVGIFPAAPPLTLYHDPEFKPSDLDVEAAVPVESGTSARLELSEGRTGAVRTLEAVQAASTIHSGGFETIPQAYTALGQWMAENNYQPAGAAREIYLTEPDAPEGMQIEIQFPVTKG